MLKIQFDEAKRVIHKSLDVCPVEVIWQFFNRSWQFMHTYHVGLTGKAAKWVVQKQKSHHQISEQIMMDISIISQ
jgi:hypothetical protein